MTIQYCFQCMISHIVVLFGFRYRLQPIRSVTIIHYHLWRRLHLYNRSRHCSIQFSSQTILDQIGPDSLVQIFNIDQTYMICHVVQFVTYRAQSDRSCHCSVQFSSQIALDPIGRESSVSFLSQNTPVRSVTSLSYLVFITDNTRSDQS